MIFIIKYIMKQSELQNLIRQEIKKSLNEELDHTYEGIEDSILQGIADWTGIQKSKLYNSMSSNAKKALATLTRELKPTLDKK
jgi:hypothetical protein